MNRYPLLLGVVLGVLLTLLVGVAVWLGVVYTGAFNVAASDAHADVVRWTLDTTMRRSVAVRADALDLPDDDASRRLLATGAQHYAESCVYCHGAPGQDPAGWTRGLRPAPPHLREAATHWTPAEIHWIVEHGIKMTAMPAFGGHHGPDELLAVTAFVSALPGLSAADYRALTDARAGAADHHQDAKRPDTAPAPARTGAEPSGTGAERPADTGAPASGQDEPGRS
jgi:mono/diheme cytochrome c family protein